MASSLVVPNHYDSDLHSLESKRNKRRRIEPEIEDNNMCQRRWNSRSEQTRYAAKLYEALRRVRQNSSSNSPPYVIKAAADGILAFAARGKTRWSRAILANRVRLNLKFKSRHRKGSAKLKAASSCLKRRALERERAMAVKKRENNSKMVPESLNSRFRLLGRLVPGCRKASFSNLVEETVDYIAALEMQVKAMAALADLFSSGAGTAV